MRLQELNSLEGDLMLTEHLLEELKKNNYPEHLIMDYGVQIKTIRKMIKEKKIKIL